MNVRCECDEKKKKNNNKYFSGSFKAQAALCARGMCIEEVCDARIGMCVHVGVSLMHNCGRFVFPVLHQPVVRSHVASVGASDRDYRPSCHRSSCDKRALQAHKSLSGCSKKRHHNPSQAVMFVYVGHSAAATFRHEAQGEDILPLALSLFLTHSLTLWHRMEGGRDGWMEG